MDEHDGFPDVCSFRDWLSYHGTDVVGVPDGGRTCPLACWLSEVEEVPCMVGVVTYGYVHEYEQYGTWAYVPVGRLPEWAIQFVHAVDCHAADKVTGEVALTLLYAACDQIGEVALYG